MFDPLNDLFILVEGSLFISAAGWLRERHQFQQSFVPIRCYNIYFSNSTSVHRQNAFYNFLHHFLYFLHYFIRCTYNWDWQNAPSARVGSIASKRKVLINSLLILLFNEFVDFVSSSVHQSFDCLGLTLTGLPTSLSGRPYGLY